MMDFQIARWLHDGTAPKCMGKDHPQLDALNMKFSIMHARLGEIALVGQPVQLGACPEFDTVRQPAPEHGEHTQQLLIDFLAFTPSQVDSFKKNQNISSYSQQDRIRDDII